MVVRSNDSIAGILSANLDRVRERIDAACTRSGRPVEEVQLLPITKYVDVSVIRALVSLGVNAIGESRVQALVDRAEHLHSALANQHPDPAWHLVGHLQRNKVKMVLPWVEMIHSVDSLRLAEMISQVAAKRDIRASILMEVNAAADPKKFGIPVAAAAYMIEEIATLPNLEVRGLMTMAEIDADETTLRQTFARLRELRDEVKKSGVAGPQFGTLSMGMSHDFEVAIEEGATIVRVGSLLFEGLMNENEAM